MIMQIQKFVDKVLPQQDMGEDELCL